MKQSKALLFAVIIAGVILFAGCSANGVDLAQVGGDKTGGFEMSVEWPDGTQAENASIKAIPQGTTRIDISIEGAGLLTALNTSLSYPQTVLTVNKIPMGNKIATVKAVYGYYNILKSQRRVSFKINQGETTNSGILPLGIAITGSTNNPVFEPTTINLAQGATLYFQSWLTSSQTITGIGTNFTLDGTSINGEGLTVFPETTRTVDLNVTGQIQGYSSQLVMSKTGWHLQKPVVSGGGAYNLYNLQFVDPNIGYAFGYGVYKTTDGGRTWNMLYSTPALGGAYFIDANTGFIGGSDNFFRKTTDGGVTWQSVSLGASHSRIKFVDSNNGFVLSDGGIRVTTNGGANWTFKTVNPPSTMRDMDFINATTGFAGCENGAIIRTTDGGNSWTTLKANGNKIQKIRFYDINKGWACASYGTVYRTTDAGQTWLSYTTPQERDLYALHFLDANNGWTGGIYGHLYYTSNGGQTWTYQSTGMSGYTFYGISATGTDNVWASGEWGFVVHYPSP